MCANNWFPKEAVKPVFLIKMKNKDTIANYKAVMAL